MRKGHEVSRGRGWHRLRAVVCAGLFALACWGPFCKAGRAEASEAASSGPEAFEVQPSESDRAERTGQTASKAKTEQFRLNKETYEKAVAYSRTWYRLYFVSVAWGIAALVLLLRLGVAAKLRDFAERQSRSRVIQAAIFVPALLLLLAVLRLPIGIYWHRLSLRYQQSVQGWGSWFWDWTKEELLSVGLGFVVALILFAVIRWKPRTWWLYFWIAAIPLGAFLVLITPWVIDPMFYKFEPLQRKNPELVESIEKLTEKAGMPIPAERIFLMEASAKTNQINAYVTGIGASKRVVIWDNMIRKLTPGEVLALVGHEIGHYALGHVFEGFAFFLGALLIGLYVAYRALEWVLGRWGAQWGIRGQEDWAALAALLLIVHVLGFLAEPVGNGFSRMVEHAADVYGLEVTHGIVPNSSEEAARAFQVMGEKDLADPNPSRFITFWLYSHPPIAERMEFAHNYDPWGRGEQPKYVKGKEGSKGGKGSKGADCSPDKRPSE
jgi:STE24 endopeptidase